MKPKKLIAVSIIALIVGVSGCEDNRIKTAEKGSTITSPTISNTRLDPYTDPHRYKIRSDGNRFALCFPSGDVEGIYSSLEIAESERDRLVEIAKKLDADKTANLWPEVK